MQICRLRWCGRSESNTLGQTGIPPVSKGRILCRSVPGCHRCEILAFGRAGSSAITTSRLEGLTSGLRIAHATVPLCAIHSRRPRRIGGEGEGLNLTRLFLLRSGYRLTGRALRHSRSVTSPYSAVSPAVTAACPLLAVSPRGYTFPSACCDLSMADPFRPVLRQVTGRGGADQTRTGGLLISNQARPTALRLHIGGRWRCRTLRLSPRTVFKTGSEAARIHLPYRLNVLHLAPSDSNRIGLGTRTPLHIQGLPSPYIARNRRSPRYEPLPFFALCLVFCQPANTSSECALNEDFRRCQITSGRSAVS